MIGRDVSYSYSTAATMKKMSRYTMEKHSTAFERNE